MFKNVAQLNITWEALGFEENGNRALFLKDQENDMLDEVYRMLHEVTVDLAKTLPSLKQMKHSVTLLETENSFEFSANVERSTSEGDALVYVKMKNSRYM
jgi:hypothetical protein